MQYSFVDSRVASMRKTVAKEESLAFQFNQPVFKALFFVIGPAYTEIWIFPRRSPYLSI